MFLSHAGSRTATSSLFTYSCSRTLLDVPSSRSNGVIADPVGRGGEAAFYPLGRAVDDDDRRSTERSIIESEAGCV